MVENVLSDLVVRIRADARGFERDLSGAQSKLQSAARGMGQVGVVLTAGVTAPLVGAATAAVKLASDSQEASDKVADVFGAARGPVDDLARSYMVLSTGAAQDLLGTTGNILTAMGMTREEAARNSVAVGELARDFASFSNVNPADAFIAINAALTGERESLKRLGIVIQETDVQNRALADSGKTAASELTKEEKAAASLALIMELGANQIGNFDRTQDSLANQARILKTEIQNLGEEIGAELVPIVQKGVDAIRGIVGWFRELDPEARKAALVIAGIAAAIGPVLLALSAMAAGLSAVITVVGAVGIPLAAATAAVVALGAVLVGLALAIDPVREALGPLLGETLRIATDAFQAFMALISGDWGSFWRGLQIVMIDIQKAILDTIIRFVANMKGSLGPLGRLLDDVSKRLSSMRVELNNQNKAAAEARRAFDSSKQSIFEFQNEELRAIQKTSELTREIDFNTQSLTKNTKAVKDQRESLTDIIKELEREAAQLQFTEAELLDMRIEQALGTETDRGRITALRDFIATLEAVDEAQEKARAAQEKANRESEAARQRAADLKEELQLQIVKLREGEEAFRRRQLALDGLTPAEIEEVIALEKQVEALEKSKQKHGEFVNVLETELGRLFDDKLPSWLSGWRDWLSGLLSSFLKFLKGLDGPLGALGNALSKILGGGGGFGGSGGGIVDTIVNLGSKAAGSAAVGAVVGGTAAGVSGAAAIGGIGSVATSAASAAAAAGGAGTAAASLGGALAAGAATAGIAAAVALGVTGLVKGLEALFGGLSDQEKIVKAAQGDSIQAKVTLKAFKDNFGRLPESFEEMGMLTQQMIEDAARSLGVLDQFTDKVRSAGTRDTFADRVRGQTTNSNMVVIEVNDRELARAVMPAIEDEARLTASIRE